MTHTTHTTNTNTHTTNANTQTTNMSFFTWHSHGTHTALTRISAPPPLPNVDVNVKIVVD